MTQTTTQAPDADFVDTASRPETRGIELIGDAERHGRARDLFFIWAAPNVSILNLTIGATLILLGLEVWQSIAVIVAASLLWILPGIIAGSGPASGTSGSVVTRAMYGILGNKLFVAFVGWFIGAVFLSLTWLASSFMGADLLRRSGFDDPVWVPIGVTLVVASVTVLVAIFGHGLILRAYPFMAAALFVIFLLVAAFILPTVDWQYTAPEPLSGPALWSSMTIGFTILASTPALVHQQPRHRPLPPALDEALAHRRRHRPRRSGAVHRVHERRGADGDRAQRRRVRRRHRRGPARPAAGVARSGAGDRRRDQHDRPQRHDHLHLQHGAAGDRVPAAPHSRRDHRRSGGHRADDLPRAVVEPARGSQPDAAVPGHRVGARHGDLRRRRHPAPLRLRRGRAVRRPRWGQVLVHRRLGIPGLAALLLGGLATALCLSTNVWVGADRAVHGVHRSLRAGRHARRRRALRRSAAHIPREGRAARDPRYVNGRVFTADPDPGKAWAEAFAIDGDTIVYVGATEGAPDAETTVDLEAADWCCPASPMPTRTCSWRSAALGQVPLTDARTLDEIQDHAARRPRCGSGCRLLRGRGWLFDSVPGGAPTAAMIDAAVADIPVYLDANDYHSCWVNSAALAELGITRDTPDPLGGHIARDAEGEPTGLLYETAATQYAWAHRDATTTDADRDEDVQRAIDAYLAAGVTGVIDMAFDEFGLAAFERAQSRHGGELPIRVAAHWIVNNTGDDAANLAQVARAAELADGASTPWLRVVGIKLILDGVIDACTAAMRHPYANGSNAEPIWPLEQLKPVVAAADAAGLQIAQHAIGDYASEIALDAIEHAVAVNGDRARAVTASSTSSTQHPERQSGWRGSA